MNSKSIFVAVILMAMLSCNSESGRKAIIEYKDGKQVPILDSTLSNVGISASDSAEVGVEYCARIWLTSDTLKLIKSYALCNFAGSLVDTANKTLDNCDDYQLKIIEDTTYFCLTPRPSDTIRDFNYRLALLTTDRRNIYHLNTLDLKFVSFRKE